MEATRKAAEDSLRWQWKNNRAAFVTWLLLRLLVLAAMVYSAVQGEYENVFICILVLFLFLLPSLLQKGLGIAFPSGFQILILVHIFACEILGELACYYVRFPHWDTVTHTVWGFLCAAIGYSLVDILNREDSTHFHLSPAFLAIVAFCFSMTIGVLWEFFEFSMDRLLGMDMQKDTVITSFTSVMLDPTQSNIPILLDNITDVAVNGESLGLGGYLDIGLFDTMEDLFVNLIGALTFALIGFFRFRRENARKIAEQFIPQVAIKKDQEFFQKYSAPEQTVVRRINSPQTVSKVWFSEKASMAIMPTIVTVVLILPDQTAAMTRPRSTAIRRRPETANSRNNTIATSHPGICPTSMNQHIAESTRILSASGSINLPKSVTWL